MHLVKFYSSDKRRILLLSLSSSTALVFLTLPVMNCHFAHLTTLNPIILIITQTLRAATRHTEAHRCITEPRGGTFVEREIHSEKHAFDSRSRMYSRKYQLLTRVADGNRTPGVMYETENKHCGVSW